MTWVDGPHFASLLVCLLAASACMPASVWMNGSTTLRAQKPAAATKEELLVFQPVSAALLCSPRALLFLSAQVKAQRSSLRPVDRRLTRHG